MAAAATADSAVLLSLYKPLLLLVVASSWAWVVSRFDKDLDYYFLKRRLWNSIQIGAGALGFFLWLMIPWFWLGLPLVLIILAGAIGGYVMYRNTKVPPTHQWHLSLDTLLSKRHEMARASAQKRASVRLINASGTPMPVPGADDPQVTAHVLLEQILEFALLRGADRFELAADANKAAISVRVDGVSYPQPESEPRVVISLLDYLKLHAGLDVSDRRRKQRGSLAIATDEFGSHQLAVRTAGSTRSLSMVVVIDRREATVLPLEKLGLLDSQRQQLQQLLRETRFVVIIACPPREGMTSTLNSLVNLHDPYTQSIMSLEEEVELELEGVTHETIEEGADVKQVEGRLSAILRTDPAVVMLSSLMDASHARLIADAGTDLRFYVGLRQDDTFGALRVWLKSVGDSALAAQGLGAIISQRLIRKLCPTCRIAYQPDPAVLKKLNLPAERVPQLYKHSGQVQVGRERMATCPECYGMGYRGQIGVFEVMVLDDEARRVLATGQIDQYRALLRRNKMLYLQETALLKVVEGLTSISEITRALGGKR